MSSRSRSEADSTARSKPGAKASALKARVDLSLVSEGDGRVVLSAAHSKSTVIADVLPSPSGEAWGRALRLAKRLGSSHSG
jgi:hypothetical protein